ncbi:MAG: hypothetical protein QXI58_00025 [Candidatus Micrarchaeia archaeon]
MKGEKSLNQKVKLLNKKLNKIAIQILDLNDRLQTINETINEIVEKLRISSSEKNKEIKDSFKNTKQSNNFIISVLELENCSLSIKRNNGFIACSINTNGTVIKKIEDLVFDFDEEKQILVIEHIDKKFKISINISPFIPLSSQLFINKFSVTLLIPPTTSEQA